MIDRMMGYHRMLYKRYKYRVDVKNKRKIKKHKDKIKDEHKDIKLYKRKDKATKIKRLETSK